MPLLSYTEVTTTEEPDRLEFTATRNTGLIEAVAGPAVLVGFTYLAWANKVWFLLVFPFIGLIYMLANRTKSNVSKLTVNSKELFSTEVFVKVPDRHVGFKYCAVKSLGFSYGSDDGPTGLYVNDTCVLSGLNREQAEAIAYRVFRKFPNIGSKDDSPTSLLHGDDSGIISLGLSGTSESEATSGPRNSRP